MTLYLIGIGGTGAKCIEAVIQLAAVGLFPEETIKLLFVDPDETNGNLERVRSSLNVYSKSYSLMQGDKQQYTWLRTPIESFDVWSPFAQTNAKKTLNSFFNYNSLIQTEPKLGQLFNVLYTQQERSAELDIGFRGRPAIGSAVMSQIDLDAFEHPWGTLIAQLQGDAGGGKATKVFLCGSMFGGTGASGLPTIGRLIANKLSKLNIRQKIEIGCLFVLPYFGFSPKPGEDPNGVFARSEQFLLNTEAALRYYVTQTEQTFDSVYLLGNQNLSQVEFSIGKNSQRNKPHFIELYAGLAARQFLLQSAASQGKVVLISRKTQGRLTWDDLPEQTVVKSHLVNATRFAYTWLANIAPELVDAKKAGVDWAQRNISWFTQFYQPSLSGLTRFFTPKGKDLPDFTDTQEQEAIVMVSNWCKDYLHWLQALHQCEGDNVELFQARAFANPNGKLAEEALSDLVIGDSRDRSKRAKDTLTKLRDELNPEEHTPPNQGTAGLAKALYINCRL